MNDSEQQDLLTDIDFHVQYGNFWPRFLAILIDGIILAILTPINLFNRTHWKSSVVLIVISVIQFAYKPFFEHIYGATPGKMALKLKVVNYGYQRADAENIIIRNIFGISSGLILLAINIYAFNLPAFDFISTSHEYLNLGYTRTLIFIWEGLWFVILLADVIFLISSDDRRSLHDRMGKTYVIKT